MWALKKTEEAGGHRDENAEVGKGHTLRKGIRYEGVRKAGVVAIAKLKGSQS